MRVWLPRPCRRQAPILKTIIKQTIRGLATLLTVPIYVSYLLTSRITSPDASLESHSQWMSLVPGQIGNHLRNAFYRLTLEQCDPSATICFGVLFSKTAARIGRNVYIGPRCMLGWVTLQDDVLLGPAVQIPSGPQTHRTESLETPIREQPGSLRRVTIGRDSWIGAASVVLADVGSQTVVGANSTVTKPLQDRSIAVGSPAKQVGERGDSAGENIAQASPSGIVLNSSSSPLFENT